MPLSECACVWEGPPSNPRLVRGCVAHLEWRNAHAKAEREAEREACAKVAEDASDDGGNVSSDAEEIAAAIRARSK